MNSQYAHLLQIRDPDGVPITFFQWIEIVGDGS